MISQEHSRCGIYSLTVKGTQEIYVGQTGDIPSRFRKHLFAIRKKSNSHKTLHRWHNQLDLIEFSVLEYCPETITRAGRVSLEHDWIERFRNSSEFIVLNKTKRPKAKPSGVLMRMPKSVTIKNIWTEEIIVFSSIKECCYQLKCSTNSIYRSNEGKQSIGGKFIVINLG